MKNILMVICTTFFAGWFAACSFKSDNVTVKSYNQPVVTAEMTSDRYSNSWEALRGLHFTLPHNETDSLEMQLLSESLELVLAGKYNEAEEILTSLQQSTPDDSVRKYSEEILGNILFYQEKWPELLQLDALSESGFEREENTLAFARAYQNAPQEEYLYHKTESRMPASLSISGTPEVEVEINGVKRTFWIDTGAHLSVLASDLAEELGIEPIGNETILTGTATEIKVEIKPTIIEELKIGALTINNHRAMIIGHENLEYNLFGLIQLVKVDGIIGLNCIKNMDLEIDYANENIVLRQPEKKSGEQRNLFWLEEPILQAATMNGQPLYFFLDTGANASSLNTYALSKIDTSGMRQEETTIVGAGGSQTVLTAEIPELSIFLGANQLIFREINAQPGDREQFFRLDGMLGSDIAQGGVMRIDFSNGRFALSMPPQLP